MKHEKEKEKEHEWKVGDRARCITDEAGEELRGLVGRVVAIESVDGEERLWWLPDDPNHRNPVHDDDDPAEAKGAFDMYPRNEDLDPIVDYAYEVAWA